jgi:hypothetical protein
MPLRAEGAAAGIPRAPGTALAAAIPGDGFHRAAAAAGTAIATGASTAARRDKPPDISLPVFRASGHMARGILA